MYDAIIVGARCAGASTAMLLAREGHKVLLVDRSVVPSDIHHGHFIHRGGPQRLNRWGVLPKIEASGCPMVTDVMIGIGGELMYGKDITLEGVALGCAPRRAVLDKILVDTAVASGTELRDQFVVEDFLNMDGQISGIVGRDLRSGKRFTEQARIVIGADGRHSRLAQHVQAPQYEEHPSATFYYFSYWSGVPQKRLEVHLGKTQIIFAFPTNDALFGVFISRPIAEFQQFRTDIEHNFLEALKQAPSLAAALQQGQREERFYGTADLPNFFRKPYGRGWALVGDAGHHKDPYMALGIADALRDAELLSTAVNAGLTNVCPMEAALAAYEQQRNAQSRPLYYENLARAKFTPPPPDFVKIRAALLQNQNQDDINHFLLVNLGSLSRESFFNPENITRILSRTHVGLETAVPV